MLAATHAPCAETPEASATNGTVSIYFGTPAGRIKALHGVNGGPLSRSFFSFHWYGKDPAGPAASAVVARKILDEFGFQKTETHLNEWHYFNVGWNEL